MMPVRTSDDCASEAAASLLALSAAAASAARLLSKFTTLTATSSPRSVLMPAAEETRAVIAWMSKSFATAALSATETVWRLTDPAGMVLDSVTLFTALFFVTLSEAVPPASPVGAGTAMLSGPSTPVALPEEPCTLCLEVASLSAGAPSGVVKDSSVRTADSWSMSAATTTVAFPKPTTRSSMDCTAERTLSS